MPKRLMKMKPSMKEYAIRWLCACGTVAIAGVIPFYCYLADISSTQLWGRGEHELFGWTYPADEWECFLFSLEALLILLGVSLAAGTILFTLVILYEKLFERHERIS